MALGTMTHTDQGAGLGLPNVALRTPGLGVLGCGFPGRGSLVSPPPTGTGGAIPVPIPVGTEPGGAWHWLCHPRAGWCHRAPAGGWGHGGVGRGRWGEP